MENFKKLLVFLDQTKHEDKTIKPSWDGHKWITLIDLPSLGKFGLGISEVKKISIDMAVDHAVLFIDDYYKKHPESNIDKDLDEFSYDVTESSDGSIMLSVRSEK